jgi:hypothetical protein
MQNVVIQKMDLLRDVAAIYYRRVVKTGFCLRDFGQTNEQQRHFNK